MYLQTIGFDTVENEPPKVFCNALTRQPNTTWLEALRFGMGNGQTAPTAPWQCGNCCANNDESDVFTIESMTIAEAPITPQRKRSEPSDTATPYSSIASSPKFMGLTESDRDRQMQDAVRKFAQRAVKGVEIALFENSAAANLLPA